jgi:hypothetical protein
VAEGVTKLAEFDFHRQGELRRVQNADKRTKRRVARCHPVSFFRKFGCGGPQPAEFGVRLDRRVTPLGVRPPSKSRIPVSNLADVAG